MILGERGGADASRSPIHQARSRDMTASAYLHPARLNLTHLSLRHM